MRFRRQQAQKVLWILLLLVAANAGCGRYSHVNWRNPGTAEMQQNRAIAQHDPYPDPEAGPEILGGRPRGFDTPPPEAAWLKKRDALQRSPDSFPRNFTAQPVYTTPVYQPNVIAPAAQPNYTTPVYQPSFMPQQTVQPVQPGFPLQ